MRSRLAGTSIREGKRGLSLHHPDVEDFLVVGVPDATYGEEVVAWIKPKPGRKLTDDDVRGFCRGSMPT